MLLVCVVTECKYKSSIGIFFSKLGKKSPKFHWEWVRISDPENTKKNPWLLKSMSRLHTKSMVGEFFLFELVDDKPTGHNEGIIKAVHEGKFVFSWPYNKSVKKKRIFFKFLDRIFEIGADRNFYGHILKNP